MEVEIQMDTIHMELTTHCTKCNATSTNGSLWWDTSQAYLSEQEMVSTLNPSLSLLPAYAYVIWYIIGLPSNMIAFTVWIRRQMINSSGCYMAALALTDNLFLVLHCIVHAHIWFPNTSLLNYPVACQVLPMVYTAVQYMSGLLVLEFTVEQYIAICHPFKRSRYCRVSIAKKVILGGVILVIILGAPQTYFFKLYEFDGYKICLIRYNAIGTNPGWTIWTWSTEMVMFGVVPLSCLILNIRVIYEVTRQGDVQLVRNYSRNSSSSLKPSRKQSTTTVMLLAVSLYWVCTEIPATIMLGLNDMYMPPTVTTIEEAIDNADVQRYMSYKTVRTIIEVISFSRYSCKVFIYLATGRMFRKQLKLFFHQNRTLKRQSSDTTMTSLATRNYSYKRGNEKVKFTNSRLPRSVSMYSRSSASQTNSLVPNRESGNTDPPTEMSTLQYESREPCETCMIINNNYKFN